MPSLKSIQLVDFSATFFPIQEDLNENAARVSTGLEQGWLRASVGKEYTMEQAAEAHREQIEGKAKGKIVINVC